MWHTHMGSGTYERDTVASFGKVFTHDDNVAPSLLGKAFDATKALYETRFQEIYNPPPTMVRLSCTFTFYAASFPHHFSLL